jgi:hypothetical protein
MLYSHPDLNPQWYPLLVPKAVVPLEEAYQFELGSLTKEVSLLVHSEPMEVKYPSMYTNLEL